MNQQIPIPRTLEKYFWDVDFQRLNFAKHRNYILGKFMLYGNLESIRWILDNFKRSVIVSFLDKRGKSVLDKKSYRFWTALVEMEDVWEEY